MPIIAAWPCTDTSLNVGLACGNACDTPTVCGWPLTSITAAVIVWLDAEPAVVDAVAVDGWVGWACVVAGIAELEADVPLVELEAVVGAVLADPDVPATASVTCCANGSLLLKRSNEKSWDLLRRGGRSDSGSRLELAAAVSVAALTVPGVALAGV